MSSLKLTSIPLHTPSLQDIAKVLESGLKKNFKNATVEVVQCPDLTNPPFSLEAKGLCGSPRIADVGGVSNLLPLANYDKIYNFKEITKLIDLPESFLIGAGAGPHKFIGCNAEMMLNLAISSGGDKNGSRACKTTPDGYKLLAIKPDLHCSILMNIFASQGKTGEVLHVNAKQRTGSDNLITCMRNTLADHYQEKVVGVGGTFRLVSGKVKCHIMQNFSTKPIHTEDELNNWLKFYDMPAPMMFFSVLVSKDPGLDLRLEHSHGYGSTHGGHYHYDVTPEEVEYDGYFNIAELLYRVDQPDEEFQFADTSARL